MDACDLPSEQATTDEIRSILSGARTVAIVGLSDDPQRYSHQVGAYLQSQGYRIIPVNPNVGEVLGEKAYPSLREVPEDADVVDIFRRPEAVPEVVDQAIEIGARAIWMQDGIVHNQAAEKARGKGIAVVMNRCMMRDHGRLGGRVSKGKSGR